MDPFTELHAKERHDEQHTENDEEYETQSDDDPWQDTELIDYWDASLSGYKSYQNKDENPAVLIPAPKPKKKSLGKRKRVQFEEPVEKPEEVIEAPAIQEEQQEQQEQEEQQEQQEQPEQEQPQEAGAEQQYDYSDYYQYYQQQPAPPPPPPPMPAMATNGEEDEAFSNLIMAWYYSGYYTGYYQARYRNR